MMGVVYELDAAEERLLRILKRHVRDEDAKLADRDLVRTVVARWERFLKEEIIDVSE